MKEEIVSGILVATLASVFIGFFYFTEVARVEGEMIKEQSKKLTNDIIDSIYLFIPSSNVDIKYPDLSITNEQVKFSNNELKKKAFIALLIVLIIGIVVSILLSRIFKLNYINILFESLIILLFVGLTEYAFLHLVSKNYTITDPNFVKYTILTKLLEKSKETDINKELKKKIIETVNEYPIVQNIFQK